MFIWYFKLADKVRHKAMPVPMFGNTMPCSSCLTVPPFTWDCEDPYGR